MMKQWLSGFTQRFHTNPHLARYGQTNAQHQWGVATLILALHPNPSRALIIEALEHDMGEAVAGDLPGPFKVSNPGFANFHRVVEYNARCEITGRGRPLLTDDEYEWLKACDMLEACLFAKHHGVWSNGWQEQWNFVLQIIKKLDFEAHHKIKTEGEHNDK